MLHSLLALLDNAVAALQTLLYIDIVQPLCFHFGLMSYDEDAYDALYWVIIGVLQVAAMYALLRPLEALRPIERWPDRKDVRADVVYTWIGKLGVINLTFFFLLQPLFHHWQSLLVMHGMPAIALDRLLPDADERPVASFLVYLVALDFAGYWYHRWQHRFGLWWELHAVHHSQQQMSLWTDDRNHFLDELLQAAFFALISLFIGMQPSQFVVLVALGNFMQSVQHVNARLPFGPLLERLVVSPAFHRRHHAIGYGHEGTRYGCNFGVLFPWWDMLFGTASWERQPEPTGIREQLPPPLGSGRDYGRGVMAQQWRAFGRMAQRLRGGHGAAVVVQD